MSERPESPESPELPDDPANRPVDVSRRFRAALDEHGHGFHYAVVKRAEELFFKQRSRWQFEEVEFPVEVRAMHTHIDLILRHAAYGSLLVGECKRANPALANWCFARAPYGFRGETSTPTYRADVVSRSRTPGTIRVDKKDVGYPGATYEIGLEVDTRKKGTAQGGKDEIKKSVAQALLGANGLVEYFATHYKLVPETIPIRLLPVVFTTAALWVSEVGLAASDLETGELSPGDDGFKRVGWLPFQYNVSPGLLNHLSQPGPANTLAKAMEQQYTRTVAIVSPLGIDDFLTWSSEALV